jgi:hypothetical protein
MESSDLCHAFLTHHTSAPKESDFHSDSGNISQGQPAVTWAGSLT